MKATLSLGTFESAGQKIAAFELRREELHPIEPPDAVSPHLMKASYLIMTDSGGIQKSSTLHWS